MECSKSSKSLERPQTSKTSQTLQASYTSRKELKPEWMPIGVYRISPPLYTNHLHPVPKSYTVGKNIAAKVNSFR